jgi:monoamine oxidase
MKTPLSRLQEMAGYEFDDVVKFYWEHGTHYYKPLSARWKDRDEFIRYAQNPVAGIYLVGECISKNQGWTEGALESVRAVEHLWGASR